jgi:succinyl-CoA synthetase alpha subunit
MLGSWNKACTEGNPLILKTTIKTSKYHDSVNLMLVARELAKMENIRDAAVVMATDANKTILSDAGLLTDESIAASPNDLVIAVRADDDLAAENALLRADELLAHKTRSQDTGKFVPKTIRGAVKSNPDANIAVISIAGRYAAAQAWDALENGLHVLLFSDNVSLEDEVSLKEYARDHGLLMMGPGAGTAILNGVCLGFANVVPTGPVGIVSAAGTGLQEVCTLLAKNGVGITQGIGTGGRDLSETVGGIMMLEGLKALQSDPDTEVIALISKPPADKIVRLILAQVEASQKPTIVCFMGGDELDLRERNNVRFAHTLYEAAKLALEAVGSAIATPAFRAIEETISPRKGQKYLRGLFSGGTLCYEAQVVWKDSLDLPVYSNAPLPGNPKMDDATISIGHTAVDLGEEEFTVGRPHPMINNDLRIRRLLQEAHDPEVKVIMLDVVLGYGVHPDPASELAPAIQEAQAIARKAGREMFFVASVTGTENDPQGYEHTVLTLVNAGVIVCESNAEAARTVGFLVK